MHIRHLALVMCAQLPMLGRFRYVGKPDRKHSANTQVACIVHMFVMHVAEELRTWPEQEQRQRHWVSFLTAYTLYKGRA